jgi:uncharacterized membrane protein YjjP (DUF1212 family)
MRLRILFNAWLILFASSRIRAAVCFLHRTYFALSKYAAVNLAECRVMEVSYMKQNEMGSVARLNRIVNEMTRRQLDGESVGLYVISLFGEI